MKVNYVYAICHKNGWWVKGKGFDYDLYKSTKLKSFDEILKIKKFLGYGYEIYKISSYKGSYYVKDLIFDYSYELKTEKI